MVGEKKTCLLDGGKGSVHVKSRGYSLGVESSKKKKVSIAQYHLNPVKHVMQQKVKIHVGRNSQMEANNTQCDCGRVKDTVNELVMIPGGLIVRRTLVTPNMILA